MDNNIILYGASGHGKVIIDILESNSLKVELIIDDNPKTQEILGVPIINTNDFNFELITNLIISIGDNKVRKKISNSLYDVNYLSINHPNAIVSKYSKIGIGTVVMAGTIINANSTIGNHCILNTGSIIEHDCNIEDFVHVSPGASLAGNVSIGEGSHIGIGACVIQSVKIGKWVTIGAGAVVLNNIPDYATAVGNPARIIKYSDKSE